MSRAEASEARLAYGSTRAVARGGVDAGYVGAPAVLVVAPQPFLADRGTPIAVAHVVETLTGLGFRVDLLTYPIGREHSSPGLHVHRGPNPLRIRDVPIGFSLRKVILDAGLAVAMRQLLGSRQYAAIHAVEEAAFLAVLARPGVPIIYDMQSSIPQQLAGSRFFALRPLRFLLESCERWLLGRVDQVVCSAGLGDTVRRVAPGTPVREWSFPGSDPASAAVAKSSPGASVLRQSLGIPADAPVAVYTGNFALYQGLRELVASIPAISARRPGFRLVLVGAGSGERGPLERLADRLGVADRLFIVDRVSRERVGSYLAMADVLLAPRSHGDNLPLKYFEYLQTGRPVVVSGPPASALKDPPAHVVGVEHRRDALERGIVEALVTAESSRAAETVVGSPPNPPIVFTNSGASAAGEGRRAFEAQVGELYSAVHQGGGREPWSMPAAGLVSVIIPARNEEATIGATVRAVLAQRCASPFEVIVVDDGSSDQTAPLANAAGATVARRSEAGGMRGGNPAAARNLGARVATGDPIVFLDADCTPEPGWLAGLLAAHARGESIVGGSLRLPQGTSWLGRCEYLGCWYMVHPGRAAGPVPNHPPANLSVSRALFEASGGFREDSPVCDGHEELGWQAESRRLGERIFFDPSASVLHRHSGTLNGVVRRSFRWGYSSLQSKCESGAVRLPGIYRYPFVLIVAAPLLALVQTLFVAGLWLRAGRVEVIAALPVVLLGRLAYSGATIVGGLRWLRVRGRRAAPSAELQPV